MYAFNYLAYNYKISGLLAANILLDFLKFYIFKKILKKVNIKTFRLYFPKIIFQKAENKNIKEIFISFGSLKLMPTSLFNNYYY